MPVVVVFPLALRWIIRAWLRSPPRVCRAVPNLSDPSPSGPGPDSTNSVSDDTGTVQSDFDLDDLGLLLFGAAPLGMLFFYVASGSVRLTVWAIKAVRSRAED